CLLDGAGADAISVDFASVLDIGASISSQDGRKATHSMRLLPKAIGKTPEHVPEKPDELPRFDHAPAYWSKTSAFALATTRTEDAKPKRAGFSVCFPLRLIEPSLSLHPHVSRGANTKPARKPQAAVAFS